MHLDTVPHDILELICQDIDAWAVYQLSNTSKSLRITLLDLLPKVLKAALISIFFPLDRDTFEAYDYHGLVKRITKEMANSIPVTIEEAITHSLVIQKSRTTDLPLVVKTDQFVHPEAKLAVGKTHSWIGVDYEPGQDSRLFVLPVNDLFAIYEVSYSDGGVKLLHLSDKDSWWRSNEGWLVSEDAEWKLDFTFSDAPECTYYHPYLIEFDRRSRSSAVVQRRKRMARGRLGEPQKLTFEVTRRYEAAKKWWNFNDTYSIARFMPRTSQATDSQLFLINWETLQSEFLAATPVSDSNYFQFQDGFVYMNEGSIKLRAMNKQGSIRWFQVTNDSDLRVNRYYPNWEIATVSKRHSWQPNENAKQVFGTLNGVPHLWTFGWEFQAWFASEVLSNLPSWQAGDDWQGWSSQIDTSKWDNLH